jgi:hypothetical protein
LFQIRTYLSVPELNLDTPLRRNLLNPEPSSATLSSPAEKLEQRFVELMRQWRPHIVHTFGMFEASVWWHGTRKRHDLSHGLRWVMQLRGGSDLEINRYIPEQSRRIAEMANDADQIVSDNLSNFSYLRELGVEKSRFAWIAPVPGTGGFDIRANPDWEIAPSQRHLLVWPKAYNTQYALALPVIEALKIAAERLPPTIRFVKLWTVQDEVKDWLYTLPETIRARCDIRGRVPREQVLALLQEARCLLAPSLVDGRPNTMLEAMASGALPIVSPLTTIREIVEEPDNVLFARNLYPTEIADAIVRAATDNELVEKNARANLDLVRQIANRATIRARVIEYYGQLCEEVKAERRNSGEPPPS